MKVSAVLYADCKADFYFQEPCSVCEALLYERNTNGLEHRRRAEEEKVRITR